ncbi:potassium voltage-gated channel protein Shaw-like isoform X3 [Pomacea canaliculata]|uniref:potassium voltage-gated channel protein Shaw-like isoform X3 n=1 Tax=Pomacea canaliculata TaxID=400727 RepID=UPI000D7257B8|nr:potassium voltage-gated channel protein Shaw-like isoform X3 [Pomacea canaliculata]XP_025092088.1 potassium voltage-gated channel protein Shaw-like isoform X3 [Pomacea canaliculata]
MFVSATHSTLPCHPTDTCLQRRPSFPQVGSGEWSLSRKLVSGQRHPTAASMATEEQDDDEDAEPDVTSASTAPSLHAAHCRCSSDKFNLPAGVATDKNQNSGSSFLTIQPDVSVCTCQLSGVSLGGLTAPDGSRTSLASAVANSNRKLRRHRARKATVIFNVGGQVFETYRSTLKRFKNSFFADDDKMRAYFRPAHGDYFFDRDPTAFGAVLNYLRTGELHVPTTMCGPALQNELEFWGVDELDIERCCWTQYNTWKTQSRSLEKLEYDRKFSTTQNLQALKGKNSGCWGSTRAAAWKFLQDPGSSRAAKAYAWVSIVFVFISIFSFCAETHPFFRVRLEDVQQFSSLYRFFNLEALQSVLKSHRQLGRNSTRPSPYNGTAGSGEDAGKETAEDNDLPHPSLLIMDLCCLIFFTIEYLTRFVCSPSKVNFLRSFQNIIDFVAISPDYVELLFLIIDPMRREGNIVMDLMFILRMLRLCRIFRLIRHVPGLWILLYTLKASFNELMLMCVFLLIGMVVFATLMHFVESQNGFRNIPVGFWWSVVTMTTVGYGDIVPQTAGGYVIGSCCAVAGLLMIAFTVPIIVSNFVLYYTHVQYGLARRDREIERLTEEQGGGGDEESGQGTESGQGSRTDLSDVRGVLPHPRPAVDSAAIALGQHVALTSHAATDDEVGEGGKCRFELSSDLVSL